MEHLKDFLRGVSNLLTSYMEYTGAAIAVTVLLVCTVIGLVSGYSLGSGAATTIAGVVIGLIIGPAVGVAVALTMVGLVSILIDIRSQQALILSELHAISSRMKNGS